MRLADDYPDLKILVVGRVSEIGPHPPNIIPLGYVDDIKKVFSQVKVLIRLTYHDSLSRFVLEALATGRYVLHTQPIPHTYLIRDYDDAKKALNTIRDKSQPNLSGFRYVQQEYAAEKVSKLFLQEFQITKDKREHSLA